MSNVNTARAYPHVVRSDEDKPTTSSVYEVYDDIDLENMPAMEWLIEENGQGVLPLKGLSEVYGDYRNGKSFLVLKWAYNVAVDLDSYVLYIIAEGAAHMGQRMRAYKKHHKVEGKTKLKIIKVPVEFLKSECLDALQRTIETALPENPALIIVDTLARCTPGMDENSSKDMGNYVAAIGKLQYAYNNHIMTVHHKPKNSTTSRGSVSLPGAMDTVIEVVKNDSIITARCDKQKDAKEFETLEYELTPVPDTESCVLVLKGQCATTHVLDTSHLNVLKVLSQYPDGIQSKEWEHASGEKRATFYRYKSALLQGDYVEEVKRGMVKITNKGIRALPAPAQIGLDLTPTPDEIANYPEDAIPYANNGTPFTDECSVCARRGLPGVFNWMPYYSDQVSGGKWYYGCGTHHPEIVESKGRKYYP